MTTHFLLVSTISTSYSSARSTLMLAATKPNDSWGIHTRRFADHSAVLVGSETMVRSTDRYLKSSSMLLLVAAVALEVLLFTSIRAGDMTGGLQLSSGVSVDKCQSIEIHRRWA